MEETIRFRASGQDLFGILHLPDADPAPAALLVMLVGGPQTRVGSHRSYTLIARELCRRGVPVLRFDYEGIGDATGAYRGFAFAGPSLEAALGFASARLPSVKNHILWSLCDGAAACALNAPALGPRTAGMILCNPYVHSAQGKARVFLRHYYVRRLWEGSFWRKLLSFEFNPVEAAASFASLVRAASGKAAPAAPASGDGAPAGTGRDGGPPPGLLGPGEDPPELPAKVMEGLEAYPGPLRIILSGDDFTAREFRALYESYGCGGKRARKGRGATALRQVDGADHTFTAAAWKLRACDLTMEAWDDFLRGKGR